MNLQQMRYFVMVARLGNVTEAAKALHIAQPPLSRQIKQLEQELGVVLFDRSGRRLHLTETGHMLLHRAEEILNLTDRTLYVNYPAVSWDRRVFYHWELSLR